MMTKKMLRSLTVAASALVLGHTYAQTSVLGNSPLSPGLDFLGWDNSTMVPLMIRHDNNQQIQFFTNYIRRMQLLPSETYTIGGFTGQSKSGSLLLARDVASFYGGGAPGRKVDRI